MSLITRFLTHVREGFLGIGEIGKVLGELYQKTLEREQPITQAGYKIISIWESDWNNEQIK